MKKKIISFVLTCSLLITGISFTAPAEAADLRIDGESAVIVDAQTGETLWSKDADTVRPVASMTKVMASYLVLEAVHDGYITMDTQVPISHYTYNFSHNDWYSNIPFEWESTYTVRDMLNAFLCYSACAAGPALGELIYGSEEAFVDAMNVKAQEMGIDAYFDQSYDEGYMSANAMATLAQTVINECPEILEITMLSEFTFDGETYPSSNELLESDDLSIGTVDGLKTGWTPQAGSCMTATATKDGTRLITVTMGAEDVDSRTSDSAKLLRYGFRMIEEGLENGYAYCTPHTATVSMNGAQLSLHAYLADGLNYVRLRDFAAILNGSGAQFGLTYENGAVLITNGSNYAGGNTVDDTIGTATVFSQLREPVLYVDGTPYAVDAYLIDGLNYMKIRDLADAVGCGIEYDSATGQVVLLPDAAA